MKRMILGLFGAVALLGACTLQQRANATSQLARDDMRPGRPHV